MAYYLDQRYNRPEIWVLENGISEKGEAYRSGAALLRDPFRTKYFKGYIDEVGGVFLWLDLSVLVGFGYQVSLVLQHLICTHGTAG
jgi:hypothetical protein